MKKLLYSMIFTGIITFNTVWSAEVPDRAALGQQLIQAVFKGKLKEAQGLIDQQANVDERDEYGYTALMWAAGKGRKDMVDALIKAQANPNIATSYGMTALMRAIRFGNSKLPGNETIYKKDIVDALIKAQANVNQADKDGRTLLMWAAINELKNIVEALIAAGANPLLETKQGSSAFDLATNDEIRKIIQDAMDKIIKKSIEAEYADSVPTDVSDLMRQFFTREK